MENAEEVLQLLEEFSKAKPKEIPRELDDYLGYVAKTGDPVFQWSLMRNLLREKLLAVVTDFYESTLTVELPPCPNVEPFNYERMKSSLLERFDAFTGAPFTIQRICELLINPRKEYNRADKYMRAIEKNILVVSTREPGSGKRPLESDETVLNGIPDIKLSESDGGLLHVPTDLPYLGAPPASNDVTIETTEPNSTVSDKIGLSINGENSFNSEDKLCNPQESQSSSIAQDAEQSSSRVEMKNDDEPLSVQVKSADESDCDSNDRLSNLVESIDPCLETNNSVREMPSETNDSILPDSIDSSESKQERLLTIKLESEEVLSDENEVSSSPSDLPEEATKPHENPNEPTDSEAEATDSCLIQDIDTDINQSPDDDKISLEDESKTFSITEVTATKSEDVELESSYEISGTVTSPVSPENTSSLESDEVIERNVNIELVEESEQSNLHPDSSNDSCFRDKLHSVETQKCDLDHDSEADSVSEVNEETKHIDKISQAPDHAGEVIVQEVIEEPSLDKLRKEESKEKDSSIELSSSSPDPNEEAVVSESTSSTSSKDQNTTLIQTEVQSSSDVLVEMYENERRDESVIQSTPHTAPDSQDQITIEEISVDPICEAEEEAMDVDDCSNHMMVSEGENEGEPMDEGDQLQS